MPRQRNERIPRTHRHICMRHLRIHVPQHVASGSAYIDAQVHGHVVNASSSLTRATHVYQLLIRLCADRVDGAHPFGCAARTLCVSHTSYMWGLCLWMQMQACIHHPRVHTQASACASSCFQWRCSNARARPLAARYNVSVSESLLVVECTLAVVNAPDMIKRFRMWACKAHPH